MSISLIIHKFSGPTNYRNGCRNGYRNGPEQTWNLMKKGTIFTQFDMTKDSHKSIGMFANWYIGVYSDLLHATQVLPFKPLDGLFTIGYLSMEQYVSTINDDSLSSVDDFSFGISYNEISKILPHWFEQLTIEKL